METFDEWWARKGRFIDPDTEDVPWFDKRKALAEEAFRAAVAQSGTSRVGHGSCMRSLDEDASVPRVTRRQS